MSPKVQEAARSCSLSPTLWTQTSQSHCPTKESNPHCPESSHSYPNSFLAPSCSLPPCDLAHPLPSAPLTLHPPWMTTNSAIPSTSLNHSFKHMLGTYSMPDPVLTVEDATSIYLIVIDTPDTCKPIFEKLNKTPFLL